ncbi:MAG: hypothetical protein Q4G69_01805 [Planctomycetia bacterium]|nr:hypothetical protein [Planctomycetia bacterium]
MLKQLTILTAFAACFVFGTNVNAQAPAAPAAAPAELSLDKLMPAPEKLDMKLFELPKDASAADLLKFVEGLEAKIPQPKSEAEMKQLVEAMSKTFNAVAEKILAMEKATPEEKAEAQQLKIVALSAKTSLDPSDKAAAEELKAFTDTMIKNAKTVDEKVKAWQMKLQAIVGAGQSPDVFEKLNALADEALKEKEDELQILGLEVKAQSCLSKGKQDPAATGEMVKFMEGILADAARSEKVRMKASELKFLGLLLDSDKDPAKQEALDKFFKELIAKDAPLESKKALYQLRLQSLMDPKKASPENDKKAAEVVELLLKEKAPELRSLGIAVKSSLLLKAAKENPEKVNDLFTFADSILANNPTPEQKEQVLGIKVQAYIAKSQADPKATDELLAFIDKSLAENPQGKILTSLANIKIQVLINKVMEDSKRLSELEKTFAEFSKNPDLKQLVDSVLPIIYMVRIKSVADQKGSIEDLNKILADIKKLMDKEEGAADLVIQSQDAIKKIGENNNAPDLWTKTVKDFADFCAASANEKVKKQGSAFSGIIEVSELIGKPIAFEGVQVGAKENGQFNSSSLSGKVYMIDLWSTSNAAYFETIEDLKNLYEGYKEKGFDIVGINLDENTQMLQRAIQVFGMPWPVVSSKLTKDGGKALPEVFTAAGSGTKILVDKEGKALLVSGDMNEIKAKIASLLGEPAKKAEEKKEDPKK